MSTCNEPECCKPVHAKERCHTHYMAARRAAGQQTRNPANARSRVNGTGGLGWSEAIYKDREPFAPSQTPACAYIEGDQLTHLFYTEKGMAVTEGMKYCVKCPVRLECLEYALEGAESGLWGGVVQSNRRQWKREKVPPAEMIVRQDSKRANTPAQI